MTYLYYGDENTEQVTTFGGPHGSTGGLRMQRFLRTPLFFATVVPRDARYKYDFVAVETRLVGPNGVIRASEEIPVRIDPLNPEVFDGRSALAMPSAPPQPYLVRSDSTPQGAVTPASLESLALKENRPLTVYTPPGYAATKASDLLIVLDGEEYDGGGGSSVPTPTILDNLIAARKIQPTVAVFVKNVAHRAQDLADSPTFADFIGKGLVPWARKSYRIHPGARRRGGRRREPRRPRRQLLRRSAFRGHRQRPVPGVGILLDHEESAGPPAFSPDPGRGHRDLIGELKEEQAPAPRVLRRRRPVRGRRRHVGHQPRAAGRPGVKGYPVTYREVDGEHDNIWWRGSLADGLVSLLGQKSH